MKENNLSKYLYDFDYKMFPKKQKLKTSLASNSFWLDCNKILVEEMVLEKYIMIWYTNSLNFLLQEMICDSSTALASANEEISKHQIAISI
jgi:hypothetical protein